VVTAKDVNELLANFTKKEFLEITLAETDWVDYRSKVLISHIWIERLIMHLRIKLDPLLKKSKSN